MEMNKLNTFQVFVPGLLQTGLNLNGTTVWPPSSDLYLSLQQNDILRKFLKIDSKADVDTWTSNFLSSEIKVGNFLPPYKNFEETFLSEQHAIFTYDWRKSQKDVAKELSLFLINLDNSLPSNTSIEIIGYSLGGCIAYISLAQMQKSELLVMNRIAKLITIGSPLKGSMNATAAILGINNQADNLNIMKIIHQENFDSIYELITSTPHIYFFDENGKALGKKDFKDLFLANPNVNKEKIERAFSFKRYYGSLRLVNIKIDCYRGLEYGAQNICKCIVKSDGTIVPFYETNNSDGKISLYESTLFDSHTYQIRTVTENHSKLLESEELQGFLNNEVNLSEIRVKIVDTNLQTITFALYAQTLTEILPIKKLTANKITLRNKMTNKDVTSNIKEKKNKEVLLTIPSSFENGCIIFDDVSFSYMKDDVKIKSKRNKIVISFNVFNSTIFY